MLLQLWWSLSSCENWLQLAVRTRQKPWKNLKEEICCSIAWLSLQARSLILLLMSKFLMVNQSESGWETKGVSVLQQAARLREDEHLAWLFTQTCSALVVRAGLHLCLLCYSTKPACSWDQSVCFHSHSITGAQHCPISHTSTSCFGLQSARDIWIWGENSKKAILLYFNCISKAKRLKGLHIRKEK